LENAMGEGLCLWQLVLVVGILIVALFVGLIVWAILIAVGLASGSSTAWIELWWGLEIVSADCVGW
jgi:hypothetical protein